MQAEMSCMADPNGCAPECDGWLADYAACEASGDPTCEILDYPACDVCIETSSDGHHGCRAETAACGADRTGCVTCVQWLAGGDPQWLCPSYDPPDSIDAAIALSSCVCSACASECASACALGYYDPRVVLAGNDDGPCPVCVGGACASQSAACDVQ